MASFSDSPALVARDLVRAFGGSPTAFDSRTDCFRKVLLLLGGNPSPFDNDVWLLRKILGALSISFSITDGETLLLRRLVLASGGRVSVYDSPNVLLDKWSDAEAAEPWTPESVPANLQAWYSADVGVSTTGSAVTGWADRSGNARNMAPPVVGNRPTLVAGAVNGLPAIQFDGTDDFLKTGSFVLAQPFTLYIAAKQITYVQFDRLIAGAGLSDFFVHQSNTVAPNVSMRTGVSTGPTLSGWSLGLYAALQMKWSGIDSKGRQTLRTEVGGNPGTLGLDGLGLGANPVGSANGNVEFLEVILRSGIDDQLTGFLHLAYLALRMGIPLRYMINEGDSLTSGAGVGATDLFPHKAVVAKSPVEWGNENVAVGGSVAQDVVDRGPTVDAYFERNATDSVLTVWVGSTDIVEGRSAEYVFSLLASYCALRRSRGYRVLVFTILPRTAITDGAKEAERAALNSMLRSGWPAFADGLVDVAADPTIGAADADLNTTYYSDGTHLTAAGHTIVATVLGAEL